MDIETLSKNGFFLDKTSSAYSNIAFLSLRSALASYFHTSIELNWLLSKSNLDKMSQLETNKEQNIRYAGNACDAISHFHHFTELVLKDILRGVHPLLAIDASDKPLLLYKLLAGEHMSDSEVESLKQIEFKTALDRIVTLIKSGKLDSSYNFIKDSKVWLEKINILRNRISHRGTFVLRYNALDEFFGKYILPFVIEITSLSEYKEIKIWVYNMCNDDIHPIEEIINEYKKTNVDQYKIQLLKLLANSAYNNSIYSGFSNMFDFLYGDKIEHAKFIAKEYKKKNYHDKTYKCPVCGIEAFVPDFDSYEDYDDNGNIIDCQDYVYKMKCYCCSFELESYVINKLTSFNVKIEDYSKITR